MVRVIIAAAAAIALAFPGSAQQRASTEPPVLGLEDALALARSDQPRIQAYGSEARASDQAAVAARSLPDPQVTGGIQNFPITGMNALRPTSDEMTMLTIGVMREQVRRSRREAEAQKILAEGLVSRMQGTAEQRRIGRAVMRAWIDAVEARAKQKLLQTLIADLRSGRKVAEAGVPSGGVAAATVLQTDAEVGFEEAQLADAQQAEARARAELARWIGAAAERPLPEAVPRIELPPDFASRLGAIGLHPELDVARAEQTVAAREVEVARQDRKPNISWSVMLGIRPKYGEMVTGTVSIPLQINRRNRQDRVVAAAQAKADAATLRLEDMARDLRSQYLGAIADYRGAEGQITRIDKDVRPALESAFNAAEARYEGGSGNLDQPLAIVRRYSEAGIQSVEAHAKRERAAADILYILGETHQ